MNERGRLGKWGEKRVRASLEARGYRILAANFRSPFGEVDLVAWDGEAVVFVEVKTRRGNQGLEQAWGGRQRKRLLRAARCFLHRADLEGENYRFLLAYVRPPAQGTDRARISWVPDPF